MISCGRCLEHENTGLNWLSAHMSQTSPETEGETGEPAQSPSPAVRKAYAQGICYGKTLPKHESAPDPSLPNPPSPPCSPPTEKQNEDDDPSVPSVEHPRSVAGDLEPTSSYSPGRPATPAPRSPLHSEAAPRQADDPKASPRAAEGRDGWEETPAPLVKLPGLTTTVPNHPVSYTSTGRALHWDNMYYSEPPAAPGDFRHNLAWRVSVDGDQQSSHREAAGEAS